MGWLAAFTLTQLIEVPIYARALRGRRMRWVAAFGASALTHPVVWWVFPRLWPAGYWSMVLAAEAFAVLVEALYLRLFTGLPRALAWSLAANGASCGAGFVVYAALGWL
jgi:hypothetical protein